MIDCSVDWRIPVVEEKRKHNLLVLGILLEVERGGTLLVVGSAHGLLPESELPHAQPVRQKDRERETRRHTDRGAEGQAHRDIEGQTEGETDRGRDRQT